MVSGGRRAPRGGFEGGIGGLGDLGGGGEKPQSKSGGGGGGKRVSVVSWVERGGG